MDRNFEDRLDREEGERIDWKPICPYCQNDDVTNMDRLTIQSYFCNQCSKHFKLGGPKDVRER